MDKQWLRFRLGLLLVCMVLSLLNLGAQLTIFRSQRSTIEKQNAQLLRDKEQFERDVRVLNLCQYDMRGLPHPVKWGH
jgi:hypothetical protein